MQQLKKEYRQHSPLELTAVCARIALETKAEELAVLDVRGQSSFADYFLIMSGRSTRHVQALAEAIESELNSKRISSRHAEGLQEGVWVLLDFGDVVTHIFYREQREFYNLEGLWHDAPRLDVRHDLGLDVKEGE